MDTPVAASSGGKINDGINRQELSTSEQSHLLPDQAPEMMEARGCGWREVVTVLRTIYRIVVRIRRHPVVLVCIALAGAFAFPAKFEDYLNRFHLLSSPKDALDWGRLVVVCIALIGLTASILVSLIQVLARRSRLRAASLFAVPAILAAGGGTGYLLLNGVGFVTILIAYPICGLAMLGATKLFIFAVFGPEKELTKSQADDLQAKYAEEDKIDPDGASVRRDIRKYGGTIPTGPYMRHRRLLDM